MIETISIIDPFFIIIKSIIIIIISIIESIITIEMKNHNTNFTKIIEILQGKVTIKEMIMKNVI